MDDAVILGAAVGVMLWFVGAEIRIAGVIGFPLDDSWIHLRFADNLARGRGFGINPGEPVAGSTAPLWTLLLAGARVLGAPGLLAGKVLGLAGYVVTALLVRRLALALGHSRGFALAGGLAAVGLGRLAWGALSGMEVPLAAALVAGALLLATSGYPIRAATAFGLATLARPEASLLVVLHVAEARALGPAAARACVAALVLAPALAFNLATVGRLIPATAAAKVEGGLLGYLEGTPNAWGEAGHRLGEYAREWGALLAADHPALPALAGAGLVLVRGAGLGWTPAALVLHPLAMALLAPYRGPAFQTGRYSTHLLPLTIVLALAAAARLRGGSAWRRRFAGLMAAGFGASLLVGLGPASRDYAWGVQNINAMQVRLGRWVADHTPPAARLAVNDIGAISYFGDRAIVDLMGLATPAILPYRRQGPLGVLHFLERTCPDYLIVFPEWFPELAARRDLFRPIETVRLPRNLVAGAAEMVVYETGWNRWAPGRTPCTPRLP